MSFQPTDRETQFAAWLQQEFWRNATNILSKHVGDSVEKTVIAVVICAGAGITINEMDSFFAEVHNAKSNHPTETYEQILLLARDSVLSKRVK